MAPADPTDYEDNKMKKLKATLPLYDSSQLLSNQQRDIAKMLNNGRFCENCVKTWRSFPWLQAFW
jgi:hypothetical protein